MGLDINVLAKPNPGDEEEFESLWGLLTGKTPPPEQEEKGFLAGLFSKPEAPDLQAELDRFQEISTPPHAVLGAPVVGKDPEADAWLRKEFEDGVYQAANFEDLFAEMKGYHALQALPDCDGFPLYSHAYMYDGVDRTSFRGKFLEACEAVIGKENLEQAWEHMLASEFAQWGTALQSRVESYAAEHGLEHALGKHDHEITGDDTREDQVNIVADAARWALFWSQRGHGAEPFF
ncbi:MAG: hypothetical protein AAF441_25995 [Pseudomonadota bacterium]